MPLKVYLLEFVQTIEGKPAAPAAWTCQAENLEHAIEQLQAEIEHAQGEAILSVKCR